jgi:hypothetical protein
MNNIATAFVKAKKAFGPALKCKTNPAFKSKYADLAACLEAVDEALLANGIAMIQETFDDQTGVTVETVFLHESGEVLRCGKLHVPASKQDPQGYGSALSYARRYSLMASCGIAAEDDDGNAASAHRPSNKGLPESSIVDHITAINDAKNGKELKDAYAKAEEAAANDSAALGRFIEAFNAKKAKALAASTASQA